MTRWSLDHPGSLARVCCGTIVWAFGFGMAGPVLSLWLKDNGFSTTVVGLNAAVYFLGIITAVALVPPLMRRRGRDCVVLAMTAVGLTVAIFPWLPSAGAVFGLRFLLGAATAFAIVPLETLLSTHSSAERRARALGFYAFAYGIGMAGGMMAGTKLYETNAYLTLAAAGGVSILAALVYRFVLPADLSVVEEVSTAPIDARQHVLSFSCSWCQGFLESGLFALLPVYLREVGYSEDATGLMLGGAVLGGIVAQVPLAWLADRFGKRPVAYGCVASTALGLWVLPSCVAVIPLLGWLFVVGAGGSAFYPLGLAIMSERVQPAARGRASAWFLGVNCVGSLVGPAVTGAAMDQFGQSSLFVVAAASVSLILVVWTVSVLVRMRVGQLETDEATDISEVRRAA